LSVAVTKFSFSSAGAAASALAVSAFFVLSACAPAAGNQSAVITIDPTETHQTMRGWEASIDFPDGSPQREQFLAAKEIIFDKSVDEIGIDRLRLTIKSGAENTMRAWDQYQSGKIDYQQWRPLRYPTVNDNRDPNVINWAGFDFSEIDFLIEQQVLPMRERLADRGRRLFINLCYVAFTKQIERGSYIHDDPEEYAEFVLATYLHLQDKYGFVPDSWEVILEPDLVPQWTPKLIGKAIVAAAKRLEENGFTPNFVAPSVTNTANGPRFIEGISRVDGAMKYVSELSYHRYQKGSPENVAAIARLGEKYDKPTAMLEFWFGRGNINVLFEDLTVGNVSSFQGRTLAGHFDLKETKDGSLNVVMRRDARDNRRIYKYVRMGAVRIGADSSAGHIALAAAFINPDGSAIVSVRTLGAGELEFRGLNAGAYEFVYTHEKGKEPKPQTIMVGDDGRTRLSIAAKGVMTLAQRLPKGAKD